MAGTKGESSLGKEKKRGIAPSNSSITHAQRSRPSQGSTGKQAPSYLRPTQSLRNDPVKNVKKAGPEDTSQKPNLLRRRSFDRPPSATRVQKALISPGRGRGKPTTTTTTPLSKSASFSAKSTIAPKATLERAPKKPIAGKPHTLSLSRSTSMITSPRTKKGISTTTTTTSASKKPPRSPDKKEVQNLETKHETEENLGHHQVEEVVKDKQAEIIDDFEIPKDEKIVHPDVINTSDQVKTVEEAEDTPPADISTVLQEHDNVPRIEEMEDKSLEEKSHHTKHDQDKDNDSKEEVTILDHDHQENNITYEEAAKPETEDEAEDNIATVEVAATKDFGEDQKQLEIREENGEGSQVGLIDQSVKEEIVEEKVEESKAEAENIVVVVLKSQVVQAGHGKKESPTPNNDVIEETANKLRQERKNKVRALVGAFETVIDKESSTSKF
ncbi:hypothetical protein PTKIN_Ptkin19aG0133200 [Pterospermum kingtungense]